MTSTEDLVRELHTQAEATRSWPAPVVPHRRTTRRPSRLGAVALVLATAVAVVLAVVAVPRLITRGTPISTAILPLTPSEVAEQRAAERQAERAAQEALRRTQAQAWIATRCPRADRLGCDAPYSLTSGDRALVIAAAGGSVPTHHGAVRSPSIGAPVSRAGSHWLLVGARGSGDASRLQVRVGDGPWVALAAGRPSLLQVTTTTRFEQVTVRDVARPLPREILMIQEYAPVP